MDVEDLGFLGPGDEPGAEADSKRPGAGSAHTKRSGASSVHAKPSGASSAHANRPASSNDHPTRFGAGSESAPSRRGWWLALAALAVIIGVFSPGIVDQRVPTPLPTPSRYVPENAGIPGSVPYVSLISVCPTQMSDPRNLDVSFVVVNLATVDLTINQLRLWLPPKHLLIRAPAASGGTCSAPGTQRVRFVLRPNQRRLFTMHLILPTPCSAPMPILAEFQFEALGMRAETEAANSEVALYDDLARSNAKAC